jgi:hypothetical protein
MIEEEEMKEERAMVNS